MSVATSTPTKGLEWPVVIFMGAIHLFAIGFCIAFPSWLGFGLFLLLYLLTGLGVTVGYHRKLTHHSFKSPKWVERFLAVLGMLAGEGPPIFWVAHHRKHHKLSDQEGDPHSPKDGFWWAHWLWLFPKQNKVQLGSLYRKWSPDLNRVPFYQHLEANYLYWQLGFGTLIFAAGWAVGGWYMAFSFLAWGFFFRMIFVLHATWMVNSLAHTYGYKSYETSDDSRNNFVVGILAHGEGWHNNHHFMQAAVNHGHRWWEVDLSFYVIYFIGLLCVPLKWIGLNHWRLVSNLKYYDRKTGTYQTLFPAK